MLHGVPCITTLTGAAAAVSAIRSIRETRTAPRQVRALQDYHGAASARTLLDS